MAKILQKNLKPLIPTVRLNLPNVPGMCLDFSDHRNFWVAGVPAVMVTDSSFFRNKNYHMDGDVPKTLDYVKMEKVVQRYIELSENVVNPWMVIRSTSHWLNQVDQLD